MLVKLESTEIEKVQTGWEEGEADTLDDLVASIISDKDVLQGIHIANVLIGQSVPWSECCLTTWVFFALKS